MTIESGKRIQVELPGFSGLAGFVETETGASLCFASTLPVRLHPGAPVTADGRQWIVQQAGPSQFVRGLKVIDLLPKGGA